jgi:hypothetical protein
MATGPCQISPAVREGTAAEKFAGRRKAEGGEVYEKLLERGDFGSLQAPKRWAFFPSPDAALGRGKKKTCKKAPLEAVGCTMGENSS